MKDLTLIARVERAIVDLQAGKAIIVTDDADRENEGDFIALGDRITADLVNLIITEGRGLLCQVVSRERAEEMGLAPMVENNTALHATAFTVSVDAIAGCTTGISTHDRATTIRTLADRRAEPQDLARPGHIFPLVAHPGGLAVRRGHTEAAFALAELCGAEPAPVLCEILDEDGSMARGGRLTALAQRLQTSEISIQDIIEYQEYLNDETSVTESARANLPTAFGRFQIRVFADRTGREREPFALIPEHYLASLQQESPSSDDSADHDSEIGAPLVRMHSECLTGECLAGLRCDCRPQLESALQQVQEHGGVVVYLRQEGRGIGLTDKVRAYALQDAGLDTYEANTALGLPADARSYDAAAAILLDLGLRRVRLLTNNPKRIEALEDAGIEVVERIPLLISPTDENRSYLETKQRRFGQLMEATDGYTGN